MFYPVTASIGDQNTQDDNLNVTWITLKSDQVGEPFYIRYAQGKHESQANLVNTSAEQTLPFQALPEHSVHNDKNRGWQVRGLVRGFS
jgi:hypothetical protein